MLKNYHSHTARCGHAWGTDDEFVLAAIDAGFQVLGFSEHTPWPFADGYQEIDTRQRIRVEELDDYIAAIQGLKEKYQDKIQIKIGLECECFPQYYDWLKSIKPKLDYLLLGVHCADHDEHLNHYYARSTKPEQVEEYLRCTLMGMESGLFAYLAHPELCLGDYPVYDDVCKDMVHSICRKAKELNMPLEYNLYGIDKQGRGRQKGLGYPCKLFWEAAADHGCTAIIGVDAHRPEHFNRRRFLDTRDYLISLGLNLIEEI
jgi:histidinol-phosphatase (PHP family)